MVSPRVWLVTGCSSGFGREAAIQLLNAGEKVVATLRRPEALNDLVKNYSADRLFVAKLDVTSTVDIKSAFAQAKGAFGRIDVVFNNAGYFAIGEAEAIPDDVARPLFEVNFWGAVHVSQEAVRFFRDENEPRGGFLLQNSSAAGLVGVPAAGFYAATKHALEGWSETLSREIDPAWNIKVTIVEPGSFKTSARDKNMVMVPQHPAYTDPALPVRNFRRIFLKDAGQPEDAEINADFFSESADAGKAVSKIIELSKLGKPPLRFAMGKDSIGAIKKKIETVSAEVEAYAGWSDNL
ncbi:NAD-P-binding protein [Trametes maxima]|nr:NAD-P-binding protein [Trametes maxima]